MSVTIGDGRKYLEIHVSGSKKVYKIPLLGSLPLKAHRELRDMQKGDAEAATDWFLAFFAEHTSEEFVDSLTMDDMRQLMAAWQEESQAASGLGMGES